MIFVVDNKKWRHSKSVSRKFFRLKISSFWSTYVKQILKEKSTVNLTKGNATWITIILIYLFSVMVEKLKKFQQSKKCQTTLLHWKFKILNVSKQKKKKIKFSRNQKWITISRSFQRIIVYIINDRKNKYFMMKRKMFHGKNWIEIYGMLNTKPENQ